MMAQQQSHRGRALGTIAAGGAVQPFHLLRWAFAQKGADIGQPFEAALFALASALFTMTVYDRVVPNNAIASLIALSIGLAIIILFDFVLKLLRAYFIDHAGAQIDREMGEEVFERLLAMRLELKKGSTGALTGLMRELETLRDFFASATIAAIVDVPFLFVTLTVVALIGGPVVLVPALMVPLVVLIGWLTHPALERLSARSMGEGLLKQSVLVEAIGSLETLKASGAGPLLAGRWSQAVGQHSDSLLRQRLIASIGVTFAGSAAMLAYAGVVVVGVTRIAENALTMGGLIACSILAGRAIAPLGQIAQLLSRLTATRTAYWQIRELMELPPEGPAEEALSLARSSGKIEARNLSFRYPGATEKALDGISFTIQPGEHVALLGRVGSGKSTIARLILGLYPPEDGLIMVDGTDVRQFDPASLRGNFGAVMQDGALLTGSVRENVSLGREAIDDDEMLRVCGISGTHQFLGQIANGYDLKLADRGEGLSGGQRQSIAIARALAGSPQIVVFDEPTSAMDAHTETGLIQRLQDELKGRTLVLITHRPPLLELVDRIILLDKGKIIADGPRDAVLKQITRPKAA
ncbi:ATP-binding cassette domain-containing protein [Qipengyuania sp. DY56-A-20]|uniref:ATP-binding cassette domain-containing protein n=1 Tax=Qipengyuania benthica TaxID=3067651 RepID=A0ABT9H9H7_9SPHN|nr:ATP-binding cassette domain-containing protein [Qipengyuania sp. DY56-A-20]MDP4539953.1 ATP-binding cassette domain-containing protein [Qipengyuania sp. DY56-A-20]